jgi:hypothetical protein
MGEQESKRASQQLLFYAPQPGERYRHYKGGEYEVIVAAVHESELYPLVVYRSLAYGYVWARPLDAWREVVEVEGRTVRRFARIPS